MSEIKDQNLQDEEHSAAGDGGERADVPPEAQAGETGEHSEETVEHGGEAEILRSELMRLQEELSQAKAQADEMRDRYLRARADLENYRKRASLETDRARDAGLDSAVLPVLTVFDDLQRALEAAGTGDPASIVPGVESVVATLERNLDALGIKAVGSVGDSFDPDLHEALTSVPTDETDKADTIAEVFQVGFQKGERLIRPARVVVYQS